MSIKELNDYIEEIKSKCLDKFDSIENKNDERLKEMSGLFEKNKFKLRKNIEKL